MISSSQRPLPDNTRHSQQTNIHAPGGTRTQDLSRPAAAGGRGFGRGVGRGVGRGRSRGGGGLTSSVKQLFARALVQKVS